MAGRNARHRWGSGALMAIGVLATTLGVVGNGSSSSAADNPATDSGPTMSEPPVTVPDTTPSTKPPTTEPPTTEPPTTKPPTTEPPTTKPPTTEPPTTKPPTTEPTTTTTSSTTVPGSPDTRAKARVSCSESAVVIELANSGTAPGTYTITWTPEIGTTTSRSVDVASGQTGSEKVAVTTPVRGTVDVRSGAEVLLDHLRIDEPCSAPRTTGSARFDCTKNQVVVTLRNEGDAAGTYTIGFTPDGAAAATSSVSVPARSESTFALTVTPPRSGTVDVRSGSEIVIDGKRVEVVCPTTTIAPTTTVGVAPTTTVRTQPAPMVLAATGSESSLILTAIGVSLFMLGLITLELRTVPGTERRRRS